jgi:hypothetical protein
MKQILLTLLCAMAAQFSFSQDTIRVKAFDYNSQTRDTTVAFPSDTDTYRQIVMLYNMRCKGAQVSSGSNRNLGCGEWDYSCNTYVEDSTRTDSLLATTAEYTIEGFSGTTYRYKETPIFDFYRNSTITTQVISSSSKDTALIGFESMTTNVGLPSSLGGVPTKIQHLYSASELSNADLSAGDIWGFNTDIVSNNITIEDLRVNMKNVSEDSLSLANTSNDILQNVYSSAYSFSTGINTIQFHSPFVWDGTSSILVELSSSKTTGLEDLRVQSTRQDTSRSIVSRDKNFIQFNGTNYVESQSYDGVMGSQNRTCEAWIRTTGTNQEIVGWGKNANGQKWVFRTNTDGSLRVEVNGGGINATTPVNDGQWHHVACVLDGTNVSNINLYVDGNLETIDAIADLSINTTSETKLRISRGINNRYFIGSIDDVRIWDIALSGTEIQELMHKRVQSTDVNFSNLKAYFRFENISGAFTKDESRTASDIDIYGTENVGQFRVTTLFKDYIYVPNRLNIGWITGNYAVTNDTAYSYDQVAQNSNTVKRNRIVPAVNTLNDDAVVVSEEFQRWNADNVENYFNESGELLETRNVTADGTLETGQLEYIRRWPSRLEIMSFVTPYGIGLDLGPDGETWAFDMTDYTPILHGNKRVFLSRGGQNQEEMDIEFLFIKGTPARDVLDIREIWPSQQVTANYTQILNNTYYAPTDFSYDTDAKALKLRSAITGHGQQGEFIPRTHSYTVNGTRTFDRLVLKECADNPVYPQGGTWIFDRAGWCPGMATDVAEYDISEFISDSKKINLDYTVDAAEGDSRYIISSQIITYGEYNHRVDAGISDILAPSNKIEYARDNPVCSTPTVEISNYGSDTLKDAIIEYWINDETNKKEIKWYGDIAPSASAIFYLPVEQEIWSTARSTNNTFHARIKLVNSQEDEDKSNNEYSSTFDLPSVFPTSFYLFTRTNNAGNETKISIRDQWGTVVFSKDDFNANEIVRDTVTLGLGCYNLTIEDSDDDGLSFFANNDGSGFFRVMKLGSGIVHNFNNDFGKRSTIKFTVQHPLTVKDKQVDLGLSVYPNPSNGKFTVEGYDLSDANCRILNNLGQVVLSQQMDIIGKQQLDITGNPTGVYFVEIEKAGILWKQRIILTK